ncbi:MAG: hypothetical protein WEB87_05295, partial [Bacteriovoracaceae bacterium]
YHYNLAVNYAKMDQLPLARFHFEKAKDSGFYSLELSKNLEQVKELMGVSRVEEKTSFTDYVFETGLSLSTYTGANVSLILFIVFLFQMKKISRWWLKVLIAALTLAPLTGQLYLKENYDQMLAMDKKQVLRGPSAIFEKNQEVPAGMKYVASKNYSGWRYIVSPSSHKGWTRNERAKEL